MKRINTTVALVFATASLWAQSPATKSFANDAAISFAKSQTTGVRYATNESQTNSIMKATTMPDVSEIISEQPVGTLYADMFRTCTGFDNGYEKSYDACATDIVVSSDQKKLYIKGICPTLTTGWIVGDIKDNGIVEFNFPQVIYHQTSDATGQSYEVTGYAWKAIVDTENLKITPDKTTQTVQFNWDGSKLTQVNADDVIAMCDASGKFQGYGSTANVFSVVTDEPVVAPSGVTSSAYTMTYTDAIQSQTVTRDVNVVIDGDDIYIGKFYNDFWIKGTFDGKKATFPSMQYLGTELLSQKFHEYMITMEINEEMTEAKFVDDIVFDYDATTKTFSSNGTLCVNVGYTKAALVGIYENPTLTDTGKEYAIDAPATPTFYQVMPYGTDGATYGGIAYINSNLTADGKVLDKDNIFYNIYLDGKLYTFSPSLYQCLTSNLTDVPYAYYDYNMTQSTGMKGYDFGVYQDQQYIFLYTNFKTVGVKAIYKNGESRYESPTAVYDVATGQVTTTGISETAFSDNAKEIETTYYDLSGRQVSTPEHGVYIKTSKLSNGQTKTVKVMK